VAPEKVVCALGTTQLTLTSYLGEVPAGTPNTTASFTEDEMAAQLKTHLTAMRDTYTEAGATATDNSGEAISVVTDNSAVDTSAAGTYTVTYSATDSSGNQGTATRSVVVASAEP